MSEDTVALAHRAVALDTYSPVELSARLTEMKEEGEIIKRFFSEVMVKDHDFGVIPGTAKPTLLKPGAEKLAEYYGYAPTVKAIDEDADRETGFYRARVTIALVSKRTGTVVAEGVGEANTKEGRYRWRKAERTCPACGSTAIIKGKEEYGGGWVCFGKKGGCGTKFADGDASIEEQASGRVENDDPFTLWNTVLKMAKKRGMIDAVLSATRSSGLFTQDIEDLNGWIDGEVISSGPTPEAAPPPRQQQAPASRLAQPAQPAAKVLEPSVQLGEFKNAHGGFDADAFRLHIRDQGFSAAALAKAAEPYSTATEWLGHNRTKTLKDLVMLTATAQREIEEAKQPALA